MNTCARVRGLFGQRYRGPNHPTPAEPAEKGYKDTVIAYPDQITRVRAKFDTEGLYVWHCHIVEHEDNEMMQPFCVGKNCCGLPLQQ